MNNSLVFPGVFRGTLDARATAISDEMALAVARELALCAEERGLSDDNILPRMEDEHMVARVAAAAGLKAQEQGLARVKHSREEYMESATRRVGDARRLAGICR